MERPSVAAAARSRPKEQPEAPQQPPQMKKKSAEEAVAELEQRLAALGGPSPVMEEEEEAVTLDVPFTTPAAPPDLFGPPPNMEEPAAAQVKVGKNALLVSYCRTTVQSVIEYRSMECT